MVVVNDVLNIHKVKARVLYQSLWKAQAPMEGSSGKPKFLIQIEIDPRIQEHKDLIAILKKEEARATDGKNPANPILGEIQTVHPATGELMSSGTLKMNIKSTERPSVMRGEISEENFKKPHIDVEPQTVIEEAEVMFKLKAYNAMGNKGLKAELISVGLFV